MFTESNILKNTVTCEHIAYSLDMLRCLSAMAVEPVQMYVHTLNTVS